MPKDDFSIFNDLSDFVKEERDKLAKSIHKELVIQTPKDTHLAESNWVVGINQPNDTTGPIKTKSQNIAQGKQDISKMPAFGKLYIQGNTDYIVYLNEGHSKQAPSKYVDTIIANQAAKK